MRVTATELPEVLLLEPRVFADERGAFFESYRAERYAELGVGGPFVQDNVSVSRRGVLRGLHLQNPRPQGKLVSVLRGAVLDVAVDVRVGSPTFGRVVARELSDANRHQMWIPPGFAHGFVVTSEDAIFAYKCTDVYDAASELSVRWDDPALAIAWPVRDVIVSPKDADAPTLAEAAASGRLPRYEPAPPAHARSAIAAIPALVEP